MKKEMNVQNLNAHELRTTNDSLSLKYESRIWVSQPSKIKSQKLSFCESQI